MTKLKSTIESAPSAQELCQMELWGPPQGSLKEAIPISIDLDFFTEQVALPTATFSVSAVRATLYLKTVRSKLARGSRLGDYAHDPDMTAEVTQSVRIALENEVDATGTIEVSVQPSFFNKLTGVVKWRKRKSKRSERDHIVKTATRISRISPRPKLKWDIVEPVAPNILKGRYIGTVGEKEVGPLCLLTMEEKSCVIEVKVAVKQQDIVIGDMNVSGSQLLSRNKKAIIDQLARRSIDENQTVTSGAVIHMDPNSILVCSSKMEIEIEDE